MAVARGRATTRDGTTRTQPIELKKDTMPSTTTAPNRESKKKLKAKPKTEGKSWQTRNLARKEKQDAHAAKLAAEPGN
jgi:hypothetical protein